MTQRDDQNEELQARRAAVFRRMREEQRQIGREARRRLELGIPSDDVPLVSSTRAQTWSTAIGTLGTAVVLAGTPSIASALGIPEALAFLGTGALLGMMFGATRDADTWESRVEHALGFGVVFGLAFGGLSLC